MPFTGTRISQELFYFGADSARVYWILRKYADSDVKLNDSSIVKEWELLQIVASFLVAGGVATAFFSTSKCSHVITQFSVPDVLFAFLCGVMLMLLFAVLLATSLCRMFLYGQYTMLLVDSKKMIDQDKGKATDDNVRQQYWGKVCREVPTMSMTGYLGIASGNHQQQACSFYL